MSHLWWELTSLMKGLLLWWGAYFSDEGPTSLMRHPSFRKKQKTSLQQHTKKYKPMDPTKTKKKIRYADKTFEYPCARKLFQKCCQIDKIRLYRLMQKRSSLRKKKFEADLKDELLKMFFRICCKSILVFYPVKNKIYSSSKRIFLDR